jgi:hypothetical protein
MTAALTSDASTWAMLLMFGFGGLGFAAFSVGMKVGQIGGRRGGRESSNP